MDVNIKKNFENTEAYVNAYVMKQLEGTDVLATSNKLPDDDFNQPTLQAKILAPAYDPFKLSLLMETSSILSPAIDTMEVNCEGFGFELVPSVDDETFKELKEEQEKTLGARPKDTGTKTDKPTRVETEIEAEFRRVMNFFKYINRTMSYTQLRRRSRRDYEATGNAYWEVLRNHITDQITGVEWLPSSSMRVGRLDKKFTDYMAKFKSSDTEIEERPDKRKFRRFAQIKESGSKPIWFKEFGDPRLMDAETGGRAVKVMGKRPDGTAFVKEIMPEGDDGNDGMAFDIKKFERGDMKLATEVLHFPLYKSPRSLPYGVPRWIGALISIIGSRLSEETNMLYFDNKTVPPGMLLVSGGKLTDNTVERVSTHIKTHIKGTKNFHSILVVEAQAKQHPNMPAVVPKMEWIKMSDAQNKDALFQNYDANNIDKVISTFRFWGGFVGRTKEINLATAKVAKELSEEQVFSPERQEFDSIINRTLLVEMNVNYWEHRSLGPQLSTPKEMADILKSLQPYLTGQEGRDIARTIFNKDFEQIEEEWTKKPFPLVIEQIRKGLLALDAGVPKPGIPGQPGQQVPGKEDEDKEGLQKWVGNLVAVRKVLAKADAELSEKVTRGEAPVK